MHPSLGGKFKKEQGFERTRSILLHLQTIFPLPQFLLNARLQEKSKKDEKTLAQHPNWVSGKFALAVPVRLASSSYSQNRIARMSPRIDLLGVSDQQSETLPLSDCSVTCNGMVL